MWFLNVVLTAHVKWLLVTLLEGNHYIPCRDLPHVRRSKVMSSSPTRYSICSKIKRNNSMITFSLAYHMQGTAVTKQVERHLTNINKD